MPKKGKDLIELKWWGAGLSERFAISLLPVLGWIRFRVEGFRSNLTRLRAASTVNEKLKSMSTARSHLKVETWH